MSEREIVSLKHKASGFVIYGEVYREDEHNIWLAPSGDGWYKLCFHIHRNLKTMPHEDFGRACKGNHVVGYYLCKQRDHHLIFDDDGDIPWVDEKALTFLDETPDIKIIVEINGKTSSLSEISEETLLNIRKEKL